MHTVYIENPNPQPIVVFHDQLPANASAAFLWIGKKPQAFAKQLEGFGASDFQYYTIYTFEIVDDPNNEDLSDAKVYVSPTDAGEFTLKLLDSNSEVIYESLLSILKNQTVIGL